ncbi:hypothetical protein SPRG_11387 [Saprolegnia parasitica CBS 223.65]|uniref:Uncharacterized protein n=1 Tax=Saprolegnia parasitica (strain CBS 223.65) TaxID=695850 RepID=A0A067BY42_SAPPC|nr:hypothetical protein SPRG_11387 [Saprolegnia parasitica CBS 223.65]KDO23464.1 hypothetical protein SPRG_11387 [Saprolegnia parasitica CBS 223.65]|eukprot:XP_012205780.1 hypothetical protein SPRG_11387 [Saprolegnia parasitica CBS 223.65]
MTMTDFEMDESDVLFGGGDDDLSMDLEPDMDYLLDDQVLQKLKEPAGHAIPVARAVVDARPETDQLLRSQSMPNKSFLSGDEQKWRMKYLSRLHIANGGDEPTRHERRSPTETETRRLRAMSMAHPSSGPIQIPLHPSSTPTQSTVPMVPLPHGRKPSYDSEYDDADRYRRHLDRFDSMEKDDDQFIPPHQMIDRGCFSLGMKHHFRQKPGNI